EPLPVDLLEYLRVLPSDEGDIERPLKKLKLETNGTDTADAVCIGRDQLTVSRAQQPILTGPDEEILRRDIGRYLRLSAGTDTQTNEEYVSLRSIPDSSASPLNATLVLPHGTLSV